MKFFSVFIFGQKIICKFWIGGLFSGAGAGNGASRHRPKQRLRFSVEPPESAFATNTLIPVSLVRNAICDVYPSDGDRICLYYGRYRVCDRTVPDDCAILGLVSYRCYVCRLLRCDALQAKGSCFALLY